MCTDLKYQFFYLSKWTLLQTIEQLCAKKKCENPIFRETTQLKVNETHNRYVIGSIPCHFWGGIIYKASLSSIQNVQLLAFFLIQQRMKYGPHVLLFLSFTIQFLWFPGGSPSSPNNSVPLVIFHFCYPISYLKKILRHLLTLFLVYVLQKNNSIKNKTPYSFVCTSEKQSQTNVQKSAEKWQKTVLSILNKVV